MGLMKMSFAGIVGRLDQGLNMQFDGRADILNTFFDGFALRMASRKCAAKDVIAAFCLLFRKLP